MINYIKTFYDDLFQYHYQKLINKDSEPSVMPLVIISFNQAAHVLSIYIILYYCFELNNLISIQSSIVAFYIVIFLINVYIYIIKKRESFILKRNRTLSKKIKYVSVIYLIFSLGLPLLLIYMFNEVWK